MINYNVKGTGVSITDELRGYIEKKLAHIEKFVASDTGAHGDIELQYAEGERGKKYRAEFMVMHSGATYRANERGDTMHEAIDIAIGELTGELARSKKKRLHALRRGASIAKDVLRGLRNRF